VRLDWWKRAWKDFQASADPDELVAESSPILIVGSAAAPIITILLLSYVPPLSEISRLSHPWISSGLIGFGGLLTYLAWKRRCRGTLGTWATLFDNAFYSAGLAVAAASSTQATGIALAVIHGLVIVSFPARSYALTRLFSLTMSAPVFGVVLWLRPSLPVGLVLVASLMMMHIVSQETRTKHDNRLRRLLLEQALGAADKLADESVQAALTTTLLTLGHFLHELRNFQTAIAANLEYLGATGELSSGPKQALVEAQEAQQAQSQLLKKTIDDLRSRSSGGSGIFLLRETIKEQAAAARFPRIEVGGEQEFEVRGNVEHFRVVMLNLTRNAVQAGAKRIEWDLQGEASGNAVRLYVNDDGDGIVEEQRSRLFDSFALSDKPGGSGLGLYLTRRYIELLGGKIEVGDSSPLAGASFVIELPARLVCPNTKGAAVPSIDMIS
jgi:signal transduction histidine kinase